jgi:Polyphosphate kinase
MFHFHNGGNELFFIGSADWLVRNLDRRVEVTTPIYDSEIQDNMREFLELQLKDNVKARVIDEKGKNKYVPKKGKKIRSQIEQYNYFKSLLD